MFWCFGGGFIRNVCLPVWSTLTIAPDKAPTASCLPLGLQLIHVAASTSINNTSHRAYALYLWGEAKTVMFFVFYNHIWATLFLWKNKRAIHFINNGTQNLPHRHSYSQSVEAEVVVRESICRLSMYVYWQCKCCAKSDFIFPPKKDLVSNNVETFDALQISFVYKRRSAHVIETYVAVVLGSVWR